MTFIQPKKNSGLWNLMLTGLGVVVVMCIFGMVALYNATVNLNHNIASVKAELDAVDAKSTALNNQIIATLNGQGLSSLASRDGLVLESKPQYFPITQSNTSDKWGIASQ